MTTTRRDFLKSISLAAGGVTAGGVTAGSAGLVNHEVSANVLPSAESKQQVSSNLEMRRRMDCIDTAQWAEAAAKVLSEYIVLGNLVTQCCNSGSGKSYEGDTLHQCVEHPVRETVPVTLDSCYYTAFSVLESELHYKFDDLLNFHILPSAMSLAHGIDEIIMDRMLNASINHTQNYKEQDALADACKFLDKHKAMGGYRKLFVPDTWKVPSELKATFSKDSGFDYKIDFKSHYAGSRDALAFCSNSVYFLSANLNGLPPYIGRSSIAVDRSFMGANISIRCSTEYDIDTGNVNVCFETLFGLAIPHPELIFNASLRN